VSGVRVGKISAITPDGEHTRFTLRIDHGVPIPADAKAVVVAQNLIAARYVQLTPGYEDSGPIMADGTVIPIDRTAVPVEWDEVKTQLTRLATDLGPHSGVDGTSIGRFIDSAANALDGNGEKLRSTLAELSVLGRTLAAGSGDIVATVKNLQQFVSVLRNSTTQIVQFEDRFATLTSVLNNSRSDLDAALRELSQAVVEVQEFVASTRDKATEQIQRLASVTQNLVDHKIDLENVLHVAPNAISNFNRIYDPNNGAIAGSFVMNNFANPVALICSSIGAIENATAPETAKLCGQYLGPALRLLNFNHLPFPFNPYLTTSPSPDKTIYSPPSLAPGGTGPAPVIHQPPAVSAYTGAGDVPPPAGWQLPSPPNGILATDGLPATPMPALYPGAPLPPPAASSLPELLLPAEAPPPGPPS
jgi:virulence factor Mce-like protein